MLADELRRARRVAFLGGAGVSTESGIPDFRSAHGLYQTMELPCEQILHHDFLMRHPAEFYDFYKKNMLYPAARPNAAHKALAQLEEMGLLSAVSGENACSSCSVASSATHCGAYVSLTSRSENDFSVGSSR